MKVESSPKKCIIWKVEISSKAKKKLTKFPYYLKDKLIVWMEAVESEGLEQTQKIRGYRDEALTGNRKGQRSIRLNRAYRAIYIVKDKKILIEEVNKHDY